MNTFRAKDLLERIYESKAPSVSDLEQALSFEREEEMRALFDFADKVRKDYCGNGIFLRGIIEFSNHCIRECFYCGINKLNRKLERYSMDKGQLLEAVSHLASCGIKTAVLQSGENPFLDASWLEEIIKEIKSRFDMAITLSAGERDAKDYELWKKAGAERYLLKIETSDQDLYSSMHPGMSFKKRLECLEILKGLDYQVGSGNIIGLPAQTVKTIAQDIFFFKEHDFDMIGIGPFIPHPETFFREEKMGQARMVLKTLALTRIVTKNTHLPSTTALGSLEKDYRLEGLKCGANVLMPNFTPQSCRRLYEIYPHKRCVSEAKGPCNIYMDETAKSIGRFIDYSKGDSLKKESVGLNV